MTTQRILVTGPESSALIAAAILSARWARQGKEVVVCPDAGPAKREQLLLRPSHDRAHSLLGISPADLQRGADAHPLLAMSVETPTGPVSLPFSQFGLSHSGVDFHHFWQRAQASQAVPDLTEFSLALALHEGQGAGGLSNLHKLPLNLGLRLDRSRYAVMLRRLLEAAGTRIVPPSEKANVDADLVVACSVNGGEGTVQNDVINVGPGEPFTDLDWELAVNCASRLAGLSEAVGGASPERSEFNRLAKLERERVEDMRNLLEAEEPLATSSAALRRKITVFEACGRIPTEDFEVFQQPEWLAALWTRGFRPRRADRLANVMPEAELTNWLSALHAQVQQIAAAGGAV